MRCVQDYNFKGKKALIRVDFNVPLDQALCVTDDTRIRGALPTIQQVRNDGGAVVLLSHLGRPTRGDEARFSLRHLLPTLQQALGTPVAFAPSCVGPDTQRQVQQLQPGDVLLLENVRFQDGETTGDPALAREWAAYGDVYVNDAFGTAHRAHASTAVLAQFFTDKLAGYLMQQELNSADKVLHGGAKPLVALIGGGKISDKIRPMARLLELADFLLVGGAVAHAFQQASGGQVGASSVTPDQVAIAQEWLQAAQQKGVQLVLPIDLVAARLVQEKAAAVFPANAVPAGWLGLDIGPQTRQAFADIVHTAKTLLWCGPMGKFENPCFQKGTQAMAAAVAQATAQGAFSLVGGGDSAAAMRRFGYAQQVSHLSTGGSALLHYLGGTPLPGVKALA